MKESQENSPQDESDQEQNHYAKHLAELLKSDEMPCLSAGACYLIKKLCNFILVF
jgi:hypothetical protein